MIKLKINEFEVLYMVSAQVTQPFADMEYQLLHVQILKLVNLYYDQLCNKMFCFFFQCDTYNE